MSKSSTKRAPYALRRPCPKCPFRTDVEPYLRPERAAEIADSIQRGSSFPCHETTVLTEDEEGEEELTEIVGVSAACAGALILQRKSGQMNQLARIAIRIGALDVDALDMSAPVPNSWQEWVARFREEPVEELEHCGVAGPDCEDPCGWYDGGVVENVEPGTCRLECEACGSAMCSACASGTPGLCCYCEEESEDFTEGS